MGRDIVIWLQSLVFVRYLAASVVALAIDVALFLLLLATGLFSPTASAISYCAGIAVHWTISSRVVFARAAAPGGLNRWRQKFLFCASAVLGLSLTVAIVAYAAATGADPRIAKLVAIAVSFTTTYLVRRLIVFAVR